MMNANGIYTNHTQRIRSQKAALQKKLDSQNRTITAATAAAGSAREAGNLKDCELYLHTAEEAKAQKAEIEKVLEALEQPLPEEECSAAWIEHSETMKKTLAGRVAEYKRERKVQAKRLLAMLQLYEQMRKKRSKYAAACRRPEHTPEHLEKILPVFSIDAEKALSDLLFYRYTGDIAETVAEHYADLLYEIMP